MNNYKPAGHTSVAPYLIVNGAAKTMVFLTKVFGATELLRKLRADGTVMHAEMRIDDTVVMLADGVDGWPPLPAHVHVYVADVDATYHRGLEAGATAVMAPSKKEDEDKRGGMQDAGGTTWWVATKVG